MSLRKKAFVFSLILFTFSVFFLCKNGLNFGLDFTGGTQFEINFQGQPDFSELREKLSKEGFGEAVVQAYGSSKDVLIKIKNSASITQQELKQKISNMFQSMEAKIVRVEYIGPQIGKTLITNGILAIFIALLGTMAYIALRFEYRFAVSAAISLIHDPVLILGLFSFFKVEFDLVALAAVLTVIGYSLNDTVVVYDRVRENFRKIGKISSEEILNLSINQTLSRTIMTSGLTFFVILALLVFGGPMLFGFSLAMMIGIVIGTYSSIYVAGALALMFGLERTHLLKKQRKVVDSMP